MTKTLKDFGIIRKETVLSNSIKVVLFEKKNAPIFIRIAFLAGNRYDPYGKEGLAHFTEHMLVAGTKSFPQKDALAVYIEKIGGSIGANTSNELLNINIGIPETNDLPIATNLLKEILFESLFDEKTIEKERGAILKEIGIAQSNPSRLSKEMWNEIAFQETPIGKPVLGTKKSVESITKDDIISFFKKNIVSNKMTVVVCGDVSIENIKEILEKSCGELKKGEQLPKNNQTSIIHRNKFVSVLPYETSEHAFIELGFRTVNIFDKNIQTFNLIADIVGKGRASLLMKKLRYENGFIYSADARQGSFLDSGKWSISTSTSSNNVNKVLEHIFTIFNEIKNMGLSEDMIQANKDRNTKSLLARFQTSESWVNFHTYYEALGLGGKTVIDYATEYEKISNDDIKNVAQKYFTSKNLYLSVVGKIEEKDIIIPKNR